MQTGISDPTATMTGLASTTATSTTSHNAAAGLQVLPSLALGLAGAFTAMLFL
jgi:hypothetical protein